MASFDIPYGSPINGDTIKTVAKRHDHISQECHPQVSPFLSIKYSNRPIGHSNRPKATGCSSVDRQILKRRKHMKSIPPKISKLQTYK